jgi:hypothetical protein
MTSFSSLQINCMVSLSFDSEIFDEQCSTYVAMYMVLDMIRKVMLCFSSGAVSLVTAEFLWVWFTGNIVERKLVDPLSQPYIQSVRPIAIVAGQETNISCNGFNLARSGTRYVSLL